MSLYQCRPLESSRHIRLLELRPPGGHAGTSHQPAEQALNMRKEDGLIVDLRHVCLDDPNRPRYEPLSYCWTGSEPIDPADREKWLRASRRDQPLGIGNGKILMITMALKIALSYLNHASETRHLWIDQLCIDQEDLQEKNQQVAIMHHVYAGGDKTLVWLGEANERTVRLFRTLDLVGRQPLDFVRRIPSLDSSWPSDRAKMREAYPSVTLDSMSDEFYDDMHDLWRCAWFSRVWVLQEAVHSNRLGFLIGDYQIAPNDVHRLHRASEERSDNVIWVDTSIGASIFRSILTFDSQAPPTMFSHLVNRTDRYRSGVTLSSDPRDLVFAMLNISAQDATFMQAPDYTLSTATVFAKATKYYFRHGKQERFRNTRPLGALQRHSGLFVNDKLGNSSVLLPPRTHGLPSWALDWARLWPMPDLTLHGYGIFDSVSPFCADKGQRAGRESEDYLLPEDHDQTIELLGLRGKIVSRITNVAIPFLNVTGIYTRGKTHYGDDCLGLEPILSDLKASTTYAPLRSRLCVRALLQMLCDGSNEGRVGYGANDDEETAGSREMARICLHYGEGSAIKFGRDGCGIVDTLGVARDRRVFVSDGKRLGLSTEGIRPGDCIAIIHGSPTPLILREVPGEGRYWFAGACYLEGAMFGEEVTWEEKDADVITLC